MLRVLAQKAPTMHKGFARKASQQLNRELPARDKLSSGTFGKHHFPSPSMFLSPHPSGKHTHHIRVASGAPSQTRGNRHQLCLFNREPRDEKDDVVVVGQLIRQFRCKMTKEQPTQIGSRSNAVNLVFQSILHH